MHTRREHDDRRVLHRGRRGAAQRVDQPGRVVGDHLNGLAPEQLGQHPGHGGAVGQHVADPRRAAEVVLEHTELAVLVTDDVDPRHVDAHPVGRRVAVGRPHEPGGAGDHLVRDEAVADDARRAVDVVEEELQRPHPLGHPRRHGGPLGAGEDPGHHVEGERALLAVEVEGDALVHEGPGQAGGPGRDVLGSHLGQRGGHGGVGRPGRAVTADHLVECRFGQPTGGRAVVVEEVSHGPQGARHVFRCRFHGREQPVTARKGQGRVGSSLIVPGVLPDEPQPLDVVALGQQLVGGDPNPLGGEVVAGEAIDDRSSPLPVGLHREANRSPSGAPYWPSLATATEKQSPLAVSVRRLTTVSIAAAAAEAAEENRGRQRWRPPLLHRRDEVTPQPVAVADHLGGRLPADAGRWRSQGTGWPGGCPRWPRW